MGDGTNGGADAATAPVRRIERVRYELRRRTLVVRRVEPIGAAFLRVVVGGEAAAGFESRGFDDHVKLFFGADPEAAEKRDYTPRRFDAARGELTLDFALHEGGVATDWARRARPGDPLTVGGPRGSMIVPADYDWHLLLGDATAAPAMARRLEELPSGARVIVRAAFADLAILGGPWRASVDLRTVASDAALVDVAREAALPAGEGYVWAAGESAVMARVRDVLYGERGHPRTAGRVAAYWKRGARGHHEELNG